MVVQFPSDLLYDIFSRLPVKSILRFKCVSPLWCNIIDDPCLAHMHLTQCVEEPSNILLLDYHTGKPPSVTFRELDQGFFKADMNLVTKSPYFLEGCCKGLVCFTKTGDDSVLVLFNPLRQEVLALPPPTTSSICKRKYGLGFDCSRNKYKVVSVSLNSQGCYEAEVYTLGTRSSWRAISKGPPCALAKNSIFACGALHWLVHHDVASDDLKGKIVSFDVGKEEFGLISPPKFGSWHLLDLGGNLALVDRSSGRHIEIWVMKDYEKKEWVKEYKIDIKPPIEMADNLLVEVIGLWKHGEILLYYLSIYLSYNPKTGEMRYVHIPGLSQDTQVLCHMGSLLSISRFQAEY